MTEPIAPQRDTRMADQLRRALDAAFSGSSEHGAFLRNGGGEYVPSPFLLLDQLEADHEAAEQRIAALTAERATWREDAEKAAQVVYRELKDTEARLTALQDALARLADDWTHHVVSLSLPTIEAREACAEQLLALLKEPHDPGAVR